MVGRREKRTLIEEGDCRSSFINKSFYRCFHGFSFKDYPFLQLYFHFLFVNGILHLNTFKELH